MAKLSFQNERKIKTLPDILAWRIPWTEDPGGLQSMGLKRVRLKLETQQQDIHQFWFGG